MNKLPTPPTSIAAYLLIFGLGVLPGLTTLESRPVLAQAATETAATAPTANLLRIDGSSSMKVTNEIRQQQIKQRSPDANFQNRYNGADAAIQNVLAGKADLAAVGRPLTPREQQQGLVAVPQKRQKIAIIVSSANRFTSNLTFEQFAKIFRGEIKDWAEVGAPPGQIQLIDRPDTNDTRIALQDYDVFKQAPFVATPRAIKVTDDSIEAAIAQLGPRGITYTISDAIVNIPGIRIVPMHKTLPLDPRYPFSQPLSYVYKGPTPSPAVAAFLSGTAVAAALPAAADPVPTQTTVRTTVRSTQDDFSPLLWLLLLPLIGGLLWLLARRRPAPAAPVNLATPRPLPPLAPVVPPAPVTPVVPVVPVVASEPQPIKLYEERLIADTSRERVGGVSINKRIETEQVDVVIPVERERVKIERIASTDVNAIALEDVAFGSGEVRMETYEQIPQIRKEAYVREQVEIAKKIERNTATAEEILRHEELDVYTQRLPGNDTQDRQNGRNIVDS